MLQTISKKTFSTVNPATGEKIETYEYQTVEEAKRVVDLSNRVFRNAWKNTSKSQRAELFRSLAKVLRSGKTEYAKTITSEMGKPITQSLSEVEKCAWSAEIFADNVENWLEDKVVATDAKRSYVTFDPLGVILSIMPWNFPFSQVFRFSIPAILAGNTTVLKHSQICTGSALAVEKMFELAGFPRGVFNTLIIDHNTVASLIAYDLVQGVSLTGSVEVGVKIAELTGRNMKKSVLELGGSDAFVVLADANIDASVKGAVDARLLNSGQSCINGKRFIVVESVAKEFTEKYAQEMAKRKVGDPLDPKTDVGPLATSGQVLTLDEQVRDALSKGGVIELGGKRFEGLGSYYHPTIISNARLDMRVMHEEVFGPVAPVYVAEDEKEAIAVANDTEFGLGASVWTRDETKVREIARNLDCGIVTFNAPVRSDPRMPFGGIKKSGIGRETSEFGMREFVNVKSVRLY